MPHSTRLLRPYKFTILFNDFQQRQKLLVFGCSFRAANEKENAKTMKKFSLELDWVAVSEINPSSGLSKSLFKPSEPHFIIKVLSRVSLTIHLRPIKLGKKACRVFEPCLLQALRPGHQARPGTRYSSSLRSIQSGFGQSDESPNLFPSKFYQAIEDKDINYVAFSKHCFISSFREEMDKF